MFEKLRKHIEKTIEDVNYVPKYIVESKSVVRISGKHVWNVDFPSTVYSNLINTYNCPVAYNIFSEQYDLNNTYNQFLYEYLIRRCSLVHTVSVLDDEDIEQLKKYIALYRAFNFGHFDETAFEPQKIDNSRQFMVTNITDNMEVIQAIYDEELSANTELDPLSFNYPDVFDGISRFNYSTQFYDDIYDYYHAFASEYINNRDNVDKLHGVLNLINIVSKPTGKNKGGSATDLDSYLYHECRRLRESNCKCEWGLFGKQNSVLRHYISSIDF